MQAAPLAENRFACVAIALLAESRTMCSKCQSREEVYCPDCDVKFCRDCCARAHYPGTSTELHSLEIIMAERRGVLVITPVMDEIFLATFLMSGQWGVHSNSENI